jgi:hypothetical protein
MRNRVRLEARNEVRNGVRFPALVGAAKSGLLLAGLAASEQSTLGEMRSLLSPGMPG